jgi:hypothetical protein
MLRGIRAVSVIVASVLPFTSSAWATSPGQSGSSTAEGIREAREQWLAGALQAALRLGCTPDSIQQLSSESVDDAIQYFGQTAKPGACLILAPISNDPESMRYSLATGGTVNGMEIRYLSDVGQVRIQHGAAVKNR